MIQPLSGTADALFEVFDTLRALYDAGGVGLDSLAGLIEAARRTDLHPAVLWPIYAACVVGSTATTTASRPTRVLSEVEGGAREPSVAQPPGASATTRAQEHSRKRDAGGIQSERV
jgi:hypothetical protein